LVWVGDDLAIDLDAAGAELVPGVFLREAGAVSRSNMVTTSSTRSSCASKSS